MNKLQVYQTVKQFALITILICSSCASVPRPIPKISFRSNVYTIEPGESATLMWEVTDADSIKITPLPVSLPLISSRDVKPTATSSYELTAYYGEKTVTHNVEIVVRKPEPKPAPKEEEKITPIVEEKNTTPSKYPKGNSQSDVAQSSRYIYDIFSADVSGYPKEIKLYVTVQDEFGNLIFNLAPPYASDSVAKEFFRNITEEVKGKLFPVGKFKAEEIHDQKREPYSFALVLDHSGSMANEIRFLERGVREFVNRKNIIDEVAAIKFDHFYGVEVPLTQSKDNFLQNYKFGGLSGYGGGTGLYAAAGDAVENLAEYGKFKHKAVVLFTDGWDNASPASALFFGKGSPDAADLVQKARKRGVSVFVVTMGDRDHVDEPTLETVAAYTNGNYQNIQRGSEIQDLFDGLPRKFSNYYILTYTPHKSEGERKTNVEVKSGKNETAIVSRRLAVGDVDVSALSNFFKSPVSLGQFTNGKADTSGMNKGMIAAFANYVKSHPDKIVKIFGHSSLKGSPVSNKALSLRRAQILKQQLIKEGVPAKNIQTFGFGASKPLYNPENFDWQAAENRRVEVVLAD